MNHQLSTTARRRMIGAAALVGIGATACVPPSTGGDTTTTTTTTTTVVSTVATLTDATFEWTISRETDHGTFAPGQVNYWSAGESDSTAATYVATDGDVTVLKKNASGTYVPIGSEPSVSWENRTKSGTGVTVTAASAAYLGQKIRYTGGTGWVDTATGASEIQWTGTFTINFYGDSSPFWIIDPKLTVATDGTGQLTATVGGFGSSMSDPTSRTPLPETPVVIADLPSVDGDNTTGFTAATGYLGTAVTTDPLAAPQVAQTSANSSWWGSWPQTFVTFQEISGLGSYFYTSGSSLDSKKPQEPITVTYEIGAP